MKINILLLFFVRPGTMIAQAWRPVTSSEKFNFRIDTAGIISNVIVVDSVNLLGGDSVYYLNRVVIKCNNYFNNNYDEVITGLQTSGYDGISAKQGAKTTSFLNPAGNLFSPFHGGVRFINSRKKLDIDNTVQPIQYFHHIQEFGDPVFRPKPILSDTTKVVNVATIHSYDSVTCCPSRISTGNGGEYEDLLQHYTENRAITDSLLNLLSQEVDGGSTESLNDDVIFSVPADAFTLYQELLNYSPFLTDTVMKAAIDKESVLPNGFIRDILVANPQSSQSEEVMAQLDQRFNPMPEEMMNEIMANYDSLSPKDQLEASVQAALIRQQNAYNNLMRYYLQDTSVTTPPEQPIELLQNITGLEQQFRLAYACYSLGLTEQMNEVVMQIPLTYVLDATSQQQYDDFISFLDILSGISADNRTIFQVTTSETSQLLTLCNSGIEPIRSWVHNILQANHIYFHHEIILAPSNLKSTNEVNNSKRKIRSASMNDVLMNVYPNPADKFVVVQYQVNRRFSEVKPFTLSITSVSAGKPTSTRCVSAPYGEIVVDLRNYPSGGYIVTLSQSQKLLGKAKFIVNP